MSGCVNTRICPRYDGSVNDSGYPTSEVVKTASPEMFDFAPKDLPWKIGPSRMVKVARSLEGEVAFVRGSVRARCGVISATEARVRARMLHMFWLLTALGPKWDGLTSRENILEKGCDCRQASISLLVLSTSDLDRE